MTTPLGLPAGVQTYSGIYVDLLHPDPAAIDPADIAHHLSLLCRFTGACRAFYSVAEHSVLVADLLRHLGAPPAACLRGLLHDAHEAYTADMGAPAKTAMREHYGRAFADATQAGVHVTSTTPYDRIAHDVDRAIEKRFLLAPLTWEVECDLTTADIWALRIEARTLMPGGGADWYWPALPRDGLLPDDVTWHAGLSHRAARRLYTDALRAHDLDVYAPWET